MKYFLLFSTSLLISANIHAQGCSDAGFCSLGALKNHIADTARQSLSFGLNYGSGEQGTSTINPYIEYSNKIGSLFLFQSKITATYASGFLGSNFDIGNLYGALTYAPNISGDNSLNIVGGVKIPLTTGDDKNSEGKPLPLDYQASIGTYDGIIGINYILEKKWEFDAALQVPVVQENKSTFFPDDYSDPRALNFPPTNDFRRKSDLLGRVGYYIRFPSSSITVKPSVSAIYHVGNDSYENTLAERMVIYGSQGFTLNGTIVATKTFKNYNRFEVVFGAPFIVRKVRPDGLTRGLVVNLQYTIAF
jgi:hypothetical protein